MKLALTFLSLCFFFLFPRSLDPSIHYLMLSQLFIFSATALVAAQANLIFTPYTGPSCTGTAGPQGQIQTSVCREMYEGSYETTCNATTVTESVYGLQQCKGSSLQFVAYLHVGQCAALQGYPTGAAGQSPTTQSAFIHSCS